MRSIKGIMALVAVAGAALPATADTFINEGCIDAPASGGFGDERRQYIELAGCAGQTLNGMLILVINDSSSTATEIDEAFYIDDNKYKFSGSSGTGYFVLWNAATTSTVPSVNAGVSDIWTKIQGNVGQGFDPGDLDSASLRNEACFQEIRNSAGEAAGEIKSSGSTTILLIDWAQTQQNAVDDSTTISLSDVYRDIECDTNNDGILDGKLEYLEVIDEVAWSHDGGREYTVDEANEWDFSAGWNPEGFIRVANTSTGADTDRDIEDTSSNTDDYRHVYRNWLMGELNSWTDLDMEDGFGAAPRPVASGSTVVDDSNGDPGSPDWGVSGIELSPGVSNAANAGAQLSAGSCRLAGSPDQNGDGVVNFQDLAAAAASGDAAAVRNIIHALR